MECTGVGQVISESISIIAASGVVCLTDVGHGGAVPKIATANMASSAVLKNHVGVIMALGAQGQFTDRLTISYLL
jgi:glucose 1-dehydrogenase